MSVAMPLRMPRDLRPGVVEESAAEKEVRCRAEHRMGAGLRQRGDLAVLQVDRVTQKGFRADQPVALIDVEVVACLRIEFGGIGDLGVVLGKVGLDETVGMLGRQSAGDLQLFGAGGDGETRRDRVVGAADSVPFSDQLLAVVIRRSRRVEHRVRRVAVHHRLAADHAHVPAGGLLEERLCGTPVARTESDGGGGAVRDEQVAEPARHGARMLRVGISRLGGKGVAVEPIEKLAPPTGHDLDLREVYVRVDETRHQKHRTVIDHPRVARERSDLGPVARRLDHPVRQQQRAIFDVAVGLMVVRAGRFAMKSQRSSAQQGLGHG